MFLILYYYLYHCGKLHKLSKLSILFSIIGTMIRSLFYIYKKNLNTPCRATSSKPWHLYSSSTAWSVIIVYLCLRPPSFVPPTHFLLGCCCVLQMHLPHVEMSGNISGQG